MTSSRLSLAVLGFVLLFALSGCAGYRLGNVSGRSIQGVHTVFVPMAHNHSLTPNLETVLTDAIIRRFNNDGTLVPSTDNADSEVDVDVTGVDTTPIRSTISDTLATAQYQLTIRAKVTFINKRMAKTILKDSQVTGQTSFYLQNDVVEGERQALPLASEDLAKNVVILVTEGW